MRRIITYSFGEDFIERTADFLCEQFPSGDFGRVACVFGGKRPALFLKQRLARKVKKALYPPRIFSMDEFVDYLVSLNGCYKNISDMDAAYLIYSLAGEHVPNILKRRIRFSEFLPWAQEIVSFIEQLDLENISDQVLTNIEKSAQIGYEVPENINCLLQQITKLRQLYHGRLRENKTYSRGLKYLAASGSVSDNPLAEFDTVIFCNFFYLYRSEQRILEQILDRGKGICIFQGNSDDWPTLKEREKHLGVSIKPSKSCQSEYRFSLYQGFDLHSQICIIREILKNIESKNNTVIVVPQPEAVIPLLSEISPFLDEFNVSLGYPLNRTSIFAFFELLFKAQESKQNTKYYSRDYLGVLQHPLVKNLNIIGESAVTRVLVHKIEDTIKGNEDSSIGGSLFLSLQEVENEGKIALSAHRTLNNMEIKINAQDCGKALSELHSLLFSGWENISDFSGFADKLEVLLDALAEKSMISLFPFNLKVAEQLYCLKQEFKSVSFSREKFSLDEIWDIFRQKLQREMISFSGSPLRGTQILGLMETRSLNFENVIIMDMNEAVLPKLKIYEPLIPREIMLNLGLNRLEKEEEIQRYQFMRLIAAAGNVCLVYEENQEKEKSRFIEELLWKKQKQEGKLEVLNVPRANFFLQTTMSLQQEIKKTPEMIEYLKNSIYSASRLNTYLNCPAQFYYQYVLGLKEKEDLLEGPQPAQLGTFIHELLEETFRQFIGKKPVIDAGFSRYFFDAMDKKFAKEIEPRMKSDSFLLKGIIKTRLEKFLKQELKRNVARIIALEEKLNDAMQVNNMQFEFNYTIDRVDEYEDKRIIIIDYKTGATAIGPKGLKNLEEMQMTRESIKENLKSFQLPLYYYFTRRRMPGVSLNAELYNIRTLERKPFIGEKDMSGSDRLMEICLGALEWTFSEILNPDSFFIAERNERRCQYCPFILLCR